MQGLSVGARRTQAAGDAPLRAPATSSATPPPWPSQKACAQRRQRHVSTPPRCYAAGESRDAPLQAVPLVEQLFGQWPARGLQPRALRLADHVAIRLRGCACRRAARRVLGIPRHVRGWRRCCDRGPRRRRGRRLHRGCIRTQGTVGESATLGAPPSQTPRRRRCHRPACCAGGRSRARPRSQALRKSKGKRSTSQSTHGTRLV